MIQGRWKSAWTACAVAGLSSCGPDSLGFDPHMGTNIRPLTIDEVTSIAAAINNAEISAGRTVEARTPNAKVQALARQIIDTHSSANVRMSQLPDLAAARSVSPAAAVLGSQSRLADQRFRSMTLNQLDAAYLSNELKAQTQALTVIHCALTSAREHERLILLLDQMEESLKSQVRDVFQLREQLALPDNGEAVVIGCVAMCAVPKEGERAATLPENLRASLCL